MTDPLHPAQLDRLAVAIADHGIEAVEPAIARLAAAARAIGVAGPMLALLADRTRTAVLRERAFAAVHAAVVVASSGTTVAGTTGVRRAA